MERGRDSGKVGKNEGTRERWGGWRGKEQRGERREETRQKVHTEGTFLLPKERKTVYEYNYKCVFLNEMCVPCGATVTT
jgi:hypothetical protein